MSHKRLLLQLQRRGGWATPAQPPSRSAHTSSGLQERAGLTRAGNTTMTAAHSPPK